MPVRGRTSLLNRLVLVPYCLMIQKYWKGGNIVLSMQQIEGFLGLSRHRKAGGDRMPRGSLAIVNRRFLEFSPNDPHSLTRCEASLVVPTFDSYQRRCLN